METCDFCKNAQKLHKHLYGWFSDDLTKQDFAKLKWKPILRSRLNTTWVDTVDIPWHASGLGDPNDDRDRRKALIA